MATKKPMKILLIMLMLIGLASFLPLLVVAAPKWPIPAGLKTIAVSLRHFYPEKVNGVGEDFSITQHASDVAALVKNLNLGKVHLLGHSRGGAVVVSVARLYPEVIRTLILADGSGTESLLPETPEDQKLAAEGRVLREKLRADLAKGDMDKAAQEFLDALNGRGWWEKLTAERKQVFRDNMGTATGSHDRPKISCADIQKFNFPVLLLTGERSPKRYGKIYSAMRQCKPDIPAPVIVPNAAHSMNRDNAGFLNKVVLDFLNQN